MKHTLKAILCLTFCFVLMANRCYHKEDVANRILVKNNSAKTIYVVPSFSYPDSSLNTLSKEYILANRECLVVYPDSQNRISLLSLCFPSEWKRCVTSDTLLLFIFDQQSVDALPQGKRLSNDQLLKTLRVTQKDLMSCNCSLSFD